MRMALCLVEGGVGIGCSNRGRGVAYVTKLIPPLVMEFHSYWCLIPTVTPSVGPRLSTLMCLAFPILPVALVSHVSRVHLGRFSPIEKEA